MTKLLDARRLGLIGPFPIAHFDYAGCAPFACDCPQIHWL